MNRRHFMLAALAAPVLAAPLLAGRASAAALQMTVFKSPTCGCCTAWVRHIRDAGFDVDARDVSQEALWQLKEQSGIVPELASCHTAFVGGYFVEGHVPAADIQRLLSERPDALGLTVPGMPIGSPGMEMGNQRDAFDTLLVRSGAEATVFARHT